jgi:hypothetical protein
MFQKKQIRLIAHELQNKLSWRIKRFLVFAEF